MTPGDAYATRRESHYPAVSSATCTVTISTVLSVVLEKNSQCIFFPQQLFNTTLINQLLVMK